MNPITVNPLHMLVGATGGDVITDTAIHVGSWYAIRAVTAPVFTILESDNLTLNGVLGNPSVLSALTPGGSSPIMFGHFTRIQLTSGQIIAYTA